MNTKFCMSMLAAGFGVFILAITAIASCFSPDLSQVVFTCSVQRPECPAGYSCQAGECVPFGDFSTPPADSGPAPADQAMQPPDLSRSGCSAGDGYSLGATAWACPGLFDFGKINTVCASGYTPCTKMDGIDQTACSKLSRFYVLKLNAAMDLPNCSSATPATLKTCDGNIPTVPTYRYGCGAKLPLVTDCSLPCGGSLQAFRCAFAPYKCDNVPSADLDANPSPDYGVLCCAKP